MIYHFATTDGFSQIFRCTTPMKSYDSNFSKVHRTQIEIFHLPSDVCIIMDSVTILFVWASNIQLLINTIIIKWSEHKQLPGASRSGRSQWEEA